MRDPLEIQIEQVDAHNVVETKGPRKSHPAVVARSSMLLALGTAETIPGPSYQVALDPPGSKNSTETTGLGMDH
eukprot:555579-Pyramimonas_sp.AAC.1